MATLRIRYTEPDYKQHLRRMFSKLFEVFGYGQDWETTVTCNVVLKGTAKPTFSFWYGMDFGTKDYSMQSDEMESHFVTVRTTGDVEKLPTNFTVEDFADAFYNFHEDSDVTIHSVVNVCYLARKLLPDYAKDKTLVGKRLITVW